MLVNLIKNISSYSFSISVKIESFFISSKPELPFNRSDQSLCSIIRGLGIDCFSTEIRSTNVNEVLPLSLFSMSLFRSYRVHSIVICIESCLFGFFVIAIFVDQVQSIRNDRGLIDALKSDENARMSSQMLPPATVLFRKVFGGGKQKKDNLHTLII